MVGFSRMIHILYIGPCLFRLPLPTPTNSARTCTQRLELGDQPKVQKLPGSLTATGTYSHHPWKERKMIFHNHLAWLYFMIFMLIFREFFGDKNRWPVFESTWRLPSTLKKQHTSLQQAHSFQTTNSKEHTQEEEGIRHLPVPGVVFSVMIFRFRFSQWKKKGPLNVV